MSGQLADETVELEGEGNSLVERVTRLPYEVPRLLKEFSVGQFAQSQGASGNENFFCDPAEDPSC